MDKRNDSVGSRESGGAIMKSHLLALLCRVFLNDNIVIISAFGVLVR